MAKVKQETSEMRDEIMKIIDEIMPQVEARIIEKLKDEKDKLTPKVKKSLKYPVM